MVKTGGENVSAAEVEMFLQTETPWVATAQVFGIPDEKWGEGVTASSTARRVGFGGGAAGVLQGKAGRIQDPEAGDFHKG